MSHDEQAALDAVTSFLSSYSQRNLEGCMSAIAASRPLLLLGTNENEVIRTADEARSALKRDFDSMTHIRWGAHRALHVEAAPTLASVILELPIAYESEGKAVESLFRYALTLTKEGERWQICSGMASVPFAAGAYMFPK